MKSKVLIVSLSLLLSGFTGFAAGWVIARFAEKQNESLQKVRAIPIVRYEYFDASRNALMIAVFNPGTQSVEIDRAELVVQTRSNHPGSAFKTPRDSNAPLVLDPGDTILVPFRKTVSVDSQADKERLWGKLEFRIRGSEDTYSLHHHFNIVSFSNGGQSQ